MNVNKLSNSFLKKLNSGTLSKMAENALQRKDYVSLKKVLVIGDFYLAKGIIEEIYETLSIEALDEVKDILKEKINDTTIYYGIDLSEIVSVEDIIKFIPGKGIVLDREWVREETAKFLIKLLGIKEKINVDELQIFSSFVDKDTFYELIDSKNISLEDDKFKGLSIDHYELEARNPLFEEESRDSSVVDVLLSKTYSKTLGQEDVRSIYEGLYNNNSVMARDIMAYSAFSILNGSKVKIVFEPDISSFYDPAKSMVQVSTGLKYDTSAIAIHELGHYMLDSLFETRALPYNLKPFLYSINPLLVSVMENLDNYGMEDSLTSLVELRKIYDDNYEKISGLLLPMLSHQKGAVQVLSKAAELMKFNATGIEKYSSLTSSSNFFKDNSPINLFISSSWGFFESLKVQSGKDDIYEAIAEDEDLKVSILLAYENYVGECSMEEKQFPLMSIQPQDEDIEDLKYISKVVIEEYFPKFAEELGLTNTQEMFLARVQDLVSRGCPYYGYELNCKNYEKDVELIVRYPELVAAGVEQDILDSFSGLVQFWDDHIHPEVLSRVEQFNSDCGNCISGIVEQVQDNIVH